MVTFNFNIIEMFIVVNISNSVKVYLQINLYKMI